MRTFSTRQCCKEYESRFGEPLGQTSLRRVMKKFGISPCKKQNVKKPLGSEYYSEYYKCIMVNIGDQENSKRSKYIPKQRYIWEKHHNQKVPKGSVVIFLDGDRNNYCPENLYCAPLNIIGDVFKHNMNSNDANIQKTALLYEELRHALYRYDKELVQKYDKEW